MCFCPFAWRINRTRTSSQRMFLRVAVTWTQECIAQPRPPQQSPCDGKKKGKRALRTKELTIRSSFLCVPQRRTSCVRRGGRWDGANANRSCVCHLPIRPRPSVVRCRGTPTAGLRKKRKDNVEAKECAVALLHAGGRGAVHGGVLGVGCRGDLQDTDARVRGSEIDTDGWSRHVVWEVCA